ncbi:MAG: glycoside hydrolase family 32 protein [Bacteroidetes bacterium]|nr:glycoside hydrolase family 32 protein [Bacteroidota bacterium]
MKYLWLLSSIILLMNSCEDPAKRENAEPEAYQEPHRPQFHFSPDSMWMNDPNGMVYYEGEYHLFYQHYPGSTVWGPMHWGHAVSKDLVHWEHLPIALYPDSLGHIFSGSAVVDWANTSGLGKEGEPPMVAIFTHHDPEGEKAGRDDYQYQSIAYSLDKGRTWTKYEDNPVLPNPGIKDFRDPKVFWHEASERWVMIFAAGNHVQLYNSANLIDWSYLSDFGQGIGGQGGVWECPDLFPLQVDGDGEKMWVLLLSINPGGPNGGSATQYFLGDFDGKTFTMDPAFAKRVAADTLTGNPYWVDYGRDNYAGVTWSDIPKSDGRRIFMGWMSNWDYANVVPTERWRSAMTVARKLDLRTTPDGPRLFSQPVQELSKIKMPSKPIPSRTVSQSMPISSLLEDQSATLSLKLQLAWPNGQQPEEIAVVLSNSKEEAFRFGLSDDQFFTDRREAGKTGFEARFAQSKHTAPRWRNANELNIKALIDVASIEFFADDGGVVMTDVFFPTEDFTELRLEVKGGRVAVRGGAIARMQSIW